MDWTLRLRSPARQAEKRKDHIERLFKKKAHTGALLSRIDIFQLLVAAVNAAVASVVTSVAEIPLFAVVG